MSEGSVTRTGRNGDPLIIGTSPAIRMALHRVAQFARSRLPILIVGATGTGKELFARHVHELSGRSGRLVDVDCGALPSDLLEALLFGRRRGAYTGAHESAHGLVEDANRGTLFLDELSNLPEAGQRKLLRVLESGEVRRVGDTAKRRVDFRLVAAVQADFKKRLKDGSFRLDLFQRVAGVVVELPSLAARTDDIGVLARHFAGRHGLRIGSDVDKVLQAREWHGNVRELRAAVDRAACLSDGKEISRAHVLEALRVGPSVVLLARDSDTEPARGQSRAELLAVCEAYGGDAREIASALGVGRATLFRRLKAAGVSLRALR